MENMSLFLVLFLQGLWGTDSISVTGAFGQDIRIKCSHSNADSNVKYFCKGACDYKDVLITSREKKKDGKYSIEDEGNTFYVTIRHLTDADSGRYWCAIERIGVDTYNEVVIKVIHDPDDSEASLRLINSEKLVYIGASLGVVVLALAIVLLIYFRYRKRKINKFSDKVNATTCFQKREARRDITTVSANEDQDTDGRINSRLTSPPEMGRGHTHDMHSHDPSESPLRPVDVTYCTVGFNDTQTGCASITLHPTDATYSVLKHTSTDESTVYSNI